ncbi:MAG: hypothetical protein KJ630_21785 [Proteobacteria bacterium]|nr:hypothetical protein [Pseudomonadota bacterium]
MSNLMNILMPITGNLKQRVAVFFIAILLLCSSCAQPPKADSPPSTKQTRQSVAEAFFLNEDFANALLEYANDYQTSLSKEDRTSALYGLACTQLIMAHSNNQMAVAIDNLEKWDAEKGDSRLTENVHLLVLAIKVQSERMQKKYLEQAHLAKQKNNLIANQKKKITQMATTVDNLQKLLEELEAIDETLQEKRKPL